MGYGSSVPRPTEIEIAVAYLHMWASNLRSKVTEGEEGENVQEAASIGDALQKAGDSLAAGNHLLWWKDSHPEEIPQPRSRPPSGANPAPKEVRVPMTSLDS